MTLKEEGESYDGFPDLSRTMPSAFFSVRGWEPKATNGASRSSMMWGATRCTLFNTELGVMSGSGADDRDERARALLISCVSRAWQSAKGRRMVFLGPGRSPGKKWSRSALLSSSGVLAAGTSGKRGGGRPTANLFAVRADLGVAAGRKEDQWSLFAFLMALK